MIVVEIPSCMFEGGWWDTLQTRNNQTFQSLSSSQPSSSSSSSSPSSSSSWTCSKLTAKYLHQNCNHHEIIFCIDVKQVKCTAVQNNWPTWLAPKFTDNFIKIILAFSCNCHHDNSLQTRWRPVSRLLYWTRRRLYFLLSNLLKL